jgi:hypothetical protein
METDAEKIIKEKLGFERMVAAASFFAIQNTDAVKSRFPNPKDNSLGLLIDRFNSDVTTFSRYLTMSVIKLPAATRGAFDDMVKSLTTKKPSTIDPTPMDFGDVLDRLNAQLDTLFPTGAPLREVAMKHRDALVDFWKRVRDPGVVVDIRGLLPSGPANPNPRPFS